MIAKIITHGSDREEAIQRMLRALDECVVDGVENTIAFQRAILSEPRFNAGNISTRYLEAFEWDGENLSEKSSEAAA